MAKGRPRKPTSLHKLSGSWDHDKKRMREQGRNTEPVPDPNVGNVPRHLTDKQKAIWKELLEQIPPQVATKADRILIEVVVRMIEKMRDGTATSANYSTLMRGLGELGITPASRSKIQVAQQEESTTDPFDEFINEQKDATLDVSTAN